MNRILLGFIAIGLISFVGCGTSKIEGSGVTDVDGNTYQSVIIGTQEWMSVNLSVDHFWNGDIIPEVKTKEEWFKAWEENRPAWFYYDNDNQYDTIYGKLYNWFAVNDSRGLAPEGWHISTDAEWTVLTDYLTANEHDGTEGTALKATSGWSDDGNGTDDYGWLGLPGGYRLDAGNFHYVGGSGSWWSSSQNYASAAWNRYLGYGKCFVTRLGTDKVGGFSVRCLRD